MGITHLAGVAGILTGLVIISVLAMAVQSPQATVTVMHGGTDVVTGLMHGMEGKQ